MFRVRSMSPDDFAFAVNITGQMGWHLARDDFEFMMELEPEGSFILLDDAKRIGLATTVSFGKIGWFGNLIVSENYRKKGAGSLLVKHSIDYLKSKNVETVGLYAHINRIPFYKRLGFTYDSEFIVLKGRGFSSSVQASLRKAGKQDIQEIIDYDQSCFGSSRGKLLEQIILDSDNLCYFSIEQGQVSGYVVAKVFKGGSELGPLVCDKGRIDVAINLLRTVLDKLEGLEVSMCVSEREAAILTVLKQLGFDETFRVARMFFGPPIVKDCIYVAESLERG